MPRWTDRRLRFRAVLSGARCVHPASVFDPISARIAEDLGFETGMLAGSVASMTVLGAPDLIVLTLSELADQAHRICRAGELPLLVDADHGYGNALSVMRTVEALEGAGIAGLCCGYELMRRGHEVIVLDASGRHGGHVFTVRDRLSDGLYADGGAEHITRPLTKRSV